MNNVTIAFEDKKNRQSAIVLNNKQVGVGYIEKIARDGFNTNTWCQVTLANIHNQSNPINFSAATLNTLIKKIQKHNFILVRY